MAKRRTNPRKRPASQADIARAKKAGVRQALILTMAIPLMSAHDVFGFGEKRLTRLLEDMMRKLDDFDAGYFTEDDANEWMHDVLGVKLVEQDMVQEYGNGN